MSIRVYHKTFGGHVHCRVFTAKSPLHTHAKAGDLVFSIDEWPKVLRGLFGSAVLIEDGGRAGALTAGGVLTTSC